MNAPEPTSAKATETIRPKSTLITRLFVVGMVLFAFTAGLRMGELGILSTTAINTVLPSSLKINTFQSSEPSRSQKTQLNTNDQNVDFGIFWEAWDLFDKQFIDRSKINTEKMFYNAVKGMVASGEDPYTFFLTPEENKQSKDSLGGKFEGIGAQLGTKDGKIMVIAPIKNSPAIRAGLKAGDFIVAVDGVPTKGKNITQVVTTIRGTAGTTVKITIERKSKEQILSIERAQIQVDNIEIVYKDKIAHVKLQQFGTTVKDEWNTSVETLAAKYRDGEISGMILDMRGNPGGLLDACVHIASDLLPMRALVVKQEGIRDSIEYSVNRLPLLADIPIVVLIDKGSASASEILAGTLRDHKRAQIVGEKSFGKGSVQATYDLSDGSGMHVTIAKWILPKGDWINGKGITPEILVQNPESDVANTVDIEKNDKQLQKAFELLK